MKRNVVRNTVNKLVDMKDFNKTTKSISGVMHFNPTTSQFYIWASGATDPHDFWYYPTKAALVAVHPVGVVDDYARVWDPATLRTRSTATLDWEDTGVSDVPKVLHTMTDPALNAALTTAIVDTYSWVIITTTVAGNSQTFQNPTAVTGTLTFMVVNKDTSTDSFDVIHNWVTTTYNPWQAGKYLWDWLDWTLVDIVSASDITAIPFDTIVWTDVQTQLEEINAKVNSENIWDRAWTEITPHTANDSVNIWTGDYLTTGAIWRDTDNEINWNTDDVLDFIIWGVSHWITSISDWVADNDKLVTQWYVDDWIGGMSANNWITNNAWTLQLGGTLIQDTSVTWPHDITFTSVNWYSWMWMNDWAWASTWFQNQIITWNVTTSMMSINSSFQTTSISVNEAGVIEVESVYPNFPWMIYHADYSADYVNRSIPDVEFVNDSIAILPIPVTVWVGGIYLTINAAVGAGEYRLILVSDTTEPSNTTLTDRLDVNLNWYTADLVDYEIHRWLWWYLKIYNWSISRIFDTFGEIIFVWFSTVDNSLIVEDVELTIVGTSYGEWGRGWKYTRCVFNPWNGNGAWYSNLDVVTDCVYNGGGTSNYNVINNCDVLNCEMNGTFSSSIICGWPNSRINWLTWTASQGWIGWNWYNIFLPNCNLGSGCNLTNFELRTGNSLSGNKLTNWLFSWTPITSSSIAWNNVFNGVTFTQAQTIQGSWNSFTNCEVTNGTLTVDTAMDKTILVGNRTQTAIVDNWTNTEAYANILL